MNLHAPLCLLLKIGPPEASGAQWTLRIVRPSDLRWCVFACLPAFLKFFKLLGNRGGHLVRREISLVWIVFNQTTRTARGNERTQATER